MVVGRDPWPVGAGRRDGAGDALDHGAVAVVIDWRSWENWLFLGPFFLFALGWLAFVGYLVHAALTGGMC